MAKDHHFDVPIEVAGRASYQPNETAQQQIHESNEHGPNLPREGGPIVRTHRSTATVNGLRALDAAELPTRNRQHFCDGPPPNRT